MNQDEALLLVREPDIKKRLTGGQTFIEFLASPNGNLSQWNNIDKIVDSLAAYWVSTSNHKVALLGLDILSLLVERLQGDFQPYYNLIHTTLLDRLGDQKDQVRDACVTLLTNIMDVAATPQVLFEKLVFGFSHKVWKVREGLCRLLVATINRFGARSLYLNKLIPHLCKLLSDPHVEVRDVATSTIVEIYRHVGDRVRQDLAKKGLPPSKLHMLYDKFDVVLQSGDMVVSETGSVASSTGSFDSVDSGSASSYIRQASSSNPAVRLSQSSETDGARPSTQSRKSFAPQKQVPLHSRLTAGAVDEESFVSDFSNNLPTVRLFSSKDVDEQLNKISSIISDEKKDWEERTKALRTLRGVIVAGGSQHETFIQHLRLMEPSLQLNAKDLRSQVVKETCVTIGFLSTSLKNQFEHSACVLLPTLFNLVGNSAKVVSTSSILAIQTTLKHTHAHRIIPIVTNYTTSRTTAIRRYSFVFIAVIFEHWHTHFMERHSTLLKDSVQKGISDADSEAREEARRAWHGLHRHFPVEADQVYQGLNLNQQKLIKGPDVASGDSLTSSTAKKTRTSISATTGTGPRRVPVRAPPSAGLRAPGTASNKFLRSRSDIDPVSARRSQMKALGSGFGTVGRSKRINTHNLSVSRNSNASRGRENERPAVSQPGSRSNSPPSHLSIRSSVGSRIRHHETTDGEHPSTRTPPSSPTMARRSRIPVSNSRTGSRAGSRLGSRATSPTGSRSGSPPRYRGGRSSSSTSHHPPMRVLPKGKEGEQIFNDVLARKLNRRAESYGASDMDDDMSDTSSVCSERSFTSTTRNGMKNKAQVEDVGEILQLCQSNQWTERKEGLSNLHVLISRRKDFSRMQLKRILEIFNRMFADPHGKVFSLFLEILPDFIANYNEDLHDWLYVLITQLLKKTGTDLLGSVQSKVLKTLQIIRSSFPTYLQFNVLSRYIIDQTQRPNLKVKVSLLYFLLELTALMESSELANSSDTRLALSRIITWTTEPKSQDVRKTAEALVIAIFELNAHAFTNMIRVLPKTFQDGAMKVLHGYKGSSNDQMSPAEEDAGQVVGVVGVAPGHSVVAPLGDTGTLDLMSPRGSMHHGAGDMRSEDVTESFRDITAGIHKLRLDSSAEEFVKQRENLPSPTRQAELQKSSHRVGLGKENKYNPSAYTLPNKQSLMEAMLDDEAFSEDLAGDGGEHEIADIAFAFTSCKDKRRTLEELCKVLRMSDVLVGLQASQQQIQWDQHFNVILSGVLDVVRQGNLDDRAFALNTLKKMMRYLSNRFRSHAELTVISVLESHKSTSKEVTRAADECGNAFCTLLPSTLCVQILAPLCTTTTGEATQACLKMLTNAINRSTADELTNQIVAGLVPGLLQCYDNVESGIRKAAVFCLVALHRVIGDANLCRHLTSLSGGKMKLLQLYIKRSQAPEYNNAEL